MKFILILLFVVLNHFTLGVTNVRKAKKVTEIKTVMISSQEIFEQKKYEQLLDFIKFHEGFRATDYNDGSYKAIGYGQRRAFFKGFIPDSVTENQADSILRISFQEHIDFANKVYPGLTKIQSYVVAHISYSIGLGTAKKAVYLYKSNGKWYLNQFQLYNYRKVDREKKNYRLNRIFEYKLFNS